MQVARLYLNSGRRRNSIVNEGSSILERVDNWKDFGIQDWDIAAAAAPAAGTDIGRKTAEEHIRTDNPGSN